MSTDSLEENRYISPEQAINKAFWMVKFPSMTVLILPLLVFMVLTKLKYLPSLGYPGLKWFILFFCVSFTGGWLIWSIQIPRWRLWAYPRVKDIKRLEQLALQNQIIWEAGSIFEKTEIMSQKVSHEIQKLREESENNAGQT